MAQWIRFRAPTAGGLVSIPGQGTRSHMHAATKSSPAATKEPTSRNQGAHELQLRSLPATTKTRCNQIKKKKILLNSSENSGAFQHASCSWIPFVLWVSCHG